ncbi:carboxypeptidase-like regulatory domain-containing protein [Flavobacterium rakeshii]|uniref:carboxypeptidase-like regulatory domain-containing protein n=1 Tax=Flavobacterium rakeshii TaxID=1038845 RepID=UPI002E7B8CDD|nr:carboxypeptidase-like regulatory domain-containing protein [Flavobacterium rakeshii]MEE1898939.1 carboxypeptidase-like regulatory domain-containing protein [Flavobacterium rakeshii]
MKITLLIVFLLQSLLVFPQTITVLDEADSAPIAFASVYLLKNNKIAGGAACNEKGKATIPNKEYDSLRITCIGYKNKSVSANAVTKNIYLSPSQYALNEIVISNNTTTIAFKGKKGRFLGFSNHMEEVVFFKNTFNKPVGIKQFSIKFESIPVYSKVRLVMYKVTDSIRHVKPGESLLTKDILFDIEPNDGNELVVNLTDENLTLPIEGAYIGIESIYSYTINNGKIIESQSVTKFETIEHRPPLYLTNYRFTDNGWRNINNEWEAILKNMKSNPDAWRNRKYFLVPDFRLTVYN